MSAVELVRHGEDYEIVYSDGTVGVIAELHQRDGEFRVYFPGDDFPISAVGADEDPERLMHRLMDWMPLDHPQRVLPQHEH